MNVLYYVCVGYCALWLGWLSWLTRRLGAHTGAPAPMPLPTPLPLPPKPKIMTFKYVYGRTAGVSTAMPRDRDIR